MWTPLTRPDFMDPRYRDIMRLTCTSCIHSFIFTKPPFFSVFHFLSYMAHIWEIGQNIDKVHTFVGIECVNLRTLVMLLQQNMFWSATLRRDYLSVTSSLPLIHCTSEICQFIVNELQPSHEQWIQWFQQETSILMSPCDHGSSWGSVPLGVVWYPIFQQEGQVAVVT